MEVTGKFIAPLSEQSGETARGPWVRGGFVIETMGEYPKKMAFTLFGEDKIEMIRQMNVGDSVDVDFSPESREYPAGSNKWFTDLRCIRVKKSGTGAVSDTVAKNFGIAQSAPTMTAPMSSDEELPF